MRAPEAIVFGPIEPDVIEPEAFVKAPGASAGNTYPPS
jgi:hypothetical protein